MAARDTIAMLSLILATLGVLPVTHTVTLVVPPLTLVLLSIAPDKLAKPLFLATDKGTLVAIPQEGAMTRPGSSPRTLSVRLVLLPIALVLCSITTHYFPIALFSALGEPTVVEIAVGREKTAMATP